MSTATPALAPPPVPTAAGGNVRWTICSLLFFSVALNYIDRNIIGILKMPLSRELGWSETDYAHVAAAFQFAYAFGYLIGGRMMDRIGVKRGLPLAVALWSLAAAAHGLCSLLPVSETLSLSLGVVSFASRSASRRAATSPPRSRRLPNGFPRRSARWPPASSTPAPTSARSSAHLRCRACMRRGVGQ
jgi:MFS family permease